MNIKIVNTVVVTGRTYGHQSVQVVKTTLLPFEAVVAMFNTTSVNENGREVVSTVNEAIELTDAEVEALGEVYVVDLDLYEE